MAQAVGSTAGTASSCVSNTTYLYITLRDSSAITLIFSTHKQAKEALDTIWKGQASFVHDDTTVVAVDQITRAQVQESADYFTYISKLKSSDCSSISTSETVHKDHPNQVITAWNTAASTLDGKSPASGDK